MNLNDHQKRASVEMEIKVICSSQFMFSGYLTELIYRMLNEINLWEIIILLWHHF